MGNCRYCREKAGIFSNKHAACESKYNSGREDIISLVARVIVGGEDFGFLDNRLTTIMKSSYIGGMEKDYLLVHGFDRAIDWFFDDGILGEDEEKWVADFANHFNLTNGELDTYGSHRKLVQGSVLRDVMNGVIADKLKVKGVVPFNLMKSEKLVWAFPDVELCEQSTETHYEGGLNGFSIRIAKGVYYRTGSFKGHPVKTSEMAHQGSGIMGITNKHIYFSGPKSFRTKLDKIVTLDPYEDGIGVQKDSATARPQVFRNLDGWFCYNLVRNLGQMV